MPRKQKLTAEKITVVVDGNTTVVTLHPPTKTRKSWYAYWSGLVSSKSTGQSDLKQATQAVERMLAGKGDRTGDRAQVLTDEEFEEIQRRHFAKRKDPAKQERAKKSLGNCLEAISAFRQISGLSHVTIATPDDCELFQNKALELNKDWRVKYSDSSRSQRHRAKRKPVGKLSPNTVVKWSVALRAAFERACKNAGNKCVRGVVPESKLLLENPWRQFTWIEGRDPIIRQFDSGQLEALLNYFQLLCPQVTTAIAAVKVFLWSYARRREVAALRWSEMRCIGHEIHFDIVGKWGIRKWFRIPHPLFEEMREFKGESDFVFARFSDQLRRHYLDKGTPQFAAKVLAEFDPENFGDWLYRRVVEWSESFPTGQICLHMFRKTSLQYARSGEDVNRLVAADARVTTAVMMTNYVRETDEEMRQKSNRTFARIAASLSSGVAKSFGHVSSESDLLKEQIRLAVASENWRLVHELTAGLTETNQVSVQPLDNKQQNCREEQPTENRAGL